MRFQPVGMAGAAILLLAGCLGPPRVEVVDLAPGRLQAGMRMAIDGKADEPAWAHAVVMPFEKTGKACFAWDQKRLYGFISKYEHQRFAFDRDEQICVTIEGDRNVARLFFDEDWRSSVLALREAWVTAGRLTRDGRTVLPGDAIAVGSAAGTAAQGLAWSVEFSLDWRVLSVGDPAVSGAAIWVYRLVPKHPITHVTEMGATGRRMVGGPGNGK